MFKAQNNEQGNIRSQISEKFDELLYIENQILGFAKSTTNLDKVMDWMYRHRVSHFNLYYDFSVLGSIYGEIEKAWLTGDDNYIQNFTLSDEYMELEDTYEMILESDDKKSPKFSSFPRAKKFRAECIYISDGQEDELEWEDLPTFVKDEWATMMEIDASHLEHEENADLYTALSCYHTLPQRYQYIPEYLMDDDTILQNFADNRALVAHHLANVAGVVATYAYPPGTYRDQLMKNFSVEDLIKYLPTVQELHEEIHETEAMHFHEEYDDLRNSICVVAADHLLKKFPGLHLGMNKHLFVPEDTDDYGSPLDFAVPLFYGYPGSEEPMVIDVWRTVFLAFDILGDNGAGGKEMMEELFAGNGEYFEEEDLAWRTSDVNDALKETDMSEFEKMFEM